MNPPTVPPYTEALFHEIYGQRSAKIADFKVVSMKGAEDVEHTTDKLKGILAELTSLEYQLQVLLGMYPSLKDHFPTLAPSPEPQPQPQSEPSPEAPNPKPSDSTTRPPFAKQKEIKPEDIEGERTALYEDGKMISSFKKDS